MQVRRWLPDQPTSIGRHDWPDEGGEGTHLRLRAGSIVVLDRQAWRVLEITGYPGDQWPESYEKAWRDHVELWWHANELRRANNQAVKPAPERAEFYKRPVVLVLRNDNLPRSAPKHWCAPASQDWQVLPEHYAVCRACGELPPCHHGEYPREEGPRRPEQSGGIPFLVPKGCCMGCAEQIKPRMRTVRFPGPNLWYPDLGEDTAVFHARSSCEDQVECYRARWQQEYEPPASRPNTSAFPGFDHFVLPRARQSLPQTPQAQAAQLQAQSQTAHTPAAHSQVPQSPQPAQTPQAVQPVQPAQPQQPVQAQAPQAQSPHAQAPQVPQGPQSQVTQTPQSLQTPLPASHALLLATAPVRGRRHTSPSRRGRRGPRAPAASRPRSRDTARTRSPTPTPTRCPTPTRLTTPTRPPILTPPPTPTRSPPRTRVPRATRSGPPRS
ncbi:hypothetical protein AWI43_12000 [Streptomyces sp. WAC04657]|uniref:hypothetical protein n=1 Tax=Streptomyces sp. WAC04657 TaxID=1779145 RepID=UPI00078826B9|nr:hypothetical protein [Streptomyces sp. WAC04657]KYG55072.1 hypothetical protein AWI43_12000 [Streptomyces sp. WAC04657]